MVSKFGVDGDGGGGDAGDAGLETVGSSTIGLNK